MTNLVTLALLSGALTATSGGLLSHQTTVDHPTGVAQTQYRGNVIVEQRQLGTPAPGGRQSSLRCHWTAGLVVNREARHASGSMLSRTFDRKSVIEGSRPGWCDTHRSAIREEVARRTDELHEHLVALAHEDHGVLRAEIDRMRG
jgi:hypothetical protein